MVNNAGVAVFAETEWCSMDAYERVIGVNLMGAIRVTKACLPLVRKAKGRVINISSLAGTCAAKPVLGSRSMDKAKISFEH